MTLPNLPTPTATKYAHGSKAVMIVGGTFASGVYTPGTGTVYYNATMKFGHKSDKHDVTQSPNTGNKQFQLGLNEGPFSGEALLDISQPGPVQLLKSGALVAICYYATSTIVSGAPTVSGVPQWQSQYCVCEDVEYSAPTNDQVKVSFTGSAGNDLTAS